MTHIEGKKIKKSDKKQVKGYDMTVFGS
jgi:hypothetical protein